ncbi:MAG TPA: helix-turn-helix domain-containing protein [Desulfosporosinus sp.]|nr:helix-turn-helix domain-containing protein [Desulfosporosinus sp.]
MTKTEQRKEWEARVTAFRASGQSTSAFCAAHDLKPHQLWYWLRKHQPVDTPSAMPSQWLTVEVGDLGLVDQRSALLVRVGRATVEVKPDFDPALLSDVVRTLAALC